MYSTDMHWHAADKQKGRQRWVALSGLPSVSDQLLVEGRRSEHLAKIGTRPRPLASKIKARAMLRGHFGV
jgi:hypothetical protein